MTRAHSPYTAAGRQGLRRVVDYERRRFRWVRGTVADRILTALEDTHARPALCDPDLAKVLDRAAHEVFNGNVAGVALYAVDLVDRARRENERLIAARLAAVEKRKAAS